MYHIILELKSGNGWAMIKNKIPIPYPFKLADIAGGTDLSEKRLHDIAEDILLLSLYGMAIARG